MFQFGKAGSRRQALAPGGGQVALIVIVQAADREVFGGQGLKRRNAKNREPLAVCGETL